MMQVDENCNDTKKHITFSEWSFVIGDNVKRRDFRLDQLLDGSNQYKRDMRTDFEFDPETKSFIPKPIAEYPVTDYLNLPDVEDIEEKKEEEFEQLSFF